MTMSRSFPVVGHLFDRYGSWRQRRRQLIELDGLDPHEYRRMALELGVAPDDLDALVRRGTDGAEELPQMLGALGFDDGAIASVAPPRMMEMRHACAGCAHKKACRADLAAHTAPAHFEDYCANANELTLLASKLNRLG